MRIRHLAILSLLALLLTPTVHGQSISRVTPQAAAAGDLLIIDGSNLAGVTAVRFFGVVGGFVQTWTVNQAPVSVSAAEVRVIVPTMAAFAPPTAVPPGSPLGTVRLVADAFVSPPVTFFFMAANPEIDTLGIGTPQSTGDGRPVTSFVLANGPPVPDNAEFVLTLENAAPGQMALLAIGVPSAGPFIPFGDGLFVIDVNLPFLLLQPFVVDAQGDAFLPAALPAAVGVTFAFQWAFRDPITNGFVVSNAMTAAL